MAEMGRIQPFAEVHFFRIAEQPEFLDDLHYRADLLVEVRDEAEVGGSDAPEHPLVGVMS